LSDVNTDRDAYLLMAKTLLARWRAAPEDWAHYMRDAPDETTSKMTLTFTVWASAGLQSVVVSHKLAAALMATTARGALDGVKLPWPSFELQVPPGLVATSSGDVTSVYVAETPDWIPINRTARTCGVTVLYNDPVSLGHVSLPSIAALSDGDSLSALELSNGLGMPFDHSEDQELRVRQLLLRLVVGVVLLINTARADKPLAYPQHPTRPEKRGVPRANVHQLKRETTIDCRQMVYDYARGTRRSSPSVVTLVRGHWRQQPHGPGRTLRRATWLEPFWRGEGPVSARVTKLRTEDEPA
jgi:hypothetical protein